MLQSVIATHVVFLSRRCTIYCTEMVFGPAGQYCSRLFSLYYGSWVLHYAIILFIAVVVLRNDPWRCITKNITSMSDNTLFRFCVLHRRRGDHTLFRFCRFCVLHCLDSIDSWFCGAIWTIVSLRCERANQGRVYVTSSNSNSTERSRVLQRHPRYRIYVIFGLRLGLR